MCGIVGAVSLRKPGLSIQHAKPMVDIIRHRGPDDAGYLFVHTGNRHQQKVNFHINLTDDEFSSQSPLLASIDSLEVKKELNSHDWDLFLGHKRLSIMDTSSQGHQPMSDLSKKTWIVYNGEIYNFKEIRQELESLGHAFKTNCDTEVVLYSYIEWGVDCLHRFNGMFAFAIYDSNKEKLFMARDRYGIKPLYYSMTGTGTLLFASEEKSILKYPEYKSMLDVEALYEYFTFQNIFTNKTFNKEISMLPSGSYFEIDISKGAQDIKTKQYWDFDFQESTVAEDERECQEELSRLFRQAVTRQLVSDVEIGSYLSGGMDSGSITAVAASKIDNLKTFTIGFDLSSATGSELLFDERSKSEELSRLYKTEHYEMVLKARDMERCLPNFAWHLETPRVGQSYPNYYAAKLASKFVKVVLSGAGGDELFAGYPWRYYKVVNNTGFDNYIDMYYQYWCRLTDEKTLQEFFSPIWDQVKHVSTRDIFSNIFKEKKHGKMTPEESVNKCLYFEAKTFLHGLLVVEDKLSMAHSLETRVPFLDNDLVDFAMKVPVGMKLSKLKEVSRLNCQKEVEPYLTKSKDGKTILRKSLSNSLPAKFINASKQGFSSPDRTWFKKDSKDYVKDVFSKVKESLPNLSLDTIEPIFEDHLSGGKNNRLMIWSIINLYQWIENNKGVENVE